MVPAMVGAVVSMLRAVLETSFASRRYRAWMSLCELICATGMYMHSTGRVCLAIIIFLGIHHLFTEDKTSKRTTLIRTTLMLAGAIILFLPFLDQVSNQGMYLQFKRRQIFGFHEAYPFCWTGLWQNMVTVFSNFHYRAVHHMHFNDSRALLRPVTATGSLGFFWLSLTLIRKKLFRCWLILVFLTTAPLIIVTPGHWRGLYFSPPVALLTLGAGLFFAVLIQLLVTSIPGIAKRRRLRTAMILILVISLLSGLLAYRYESYTSGLYSPRRTDMLTRLYDELADEPDVPHYFSMTIPEMTPGYAIFHLMGSAWFSRYGALAFDPIRHMRDTSRGKRLDPGTLDADTARFVLSNRDMKRLKEVKTIFHGYTLIYLPVSQLILVEVKGEDDETGMDGSGDLSSVKIRTGA